MSNKENVKIISARPEDADFIAWIVAQGMHMDGVPSFLIKHGARENTLYSWQNTRLLRCDIMALFDQISEDIKSAMKARDKVRLETLRNIKKVFLEAKTAPGANDTLADADALKIISKLAKQGKETAATYTQAGRQDLADAELAQVEVLESYLPKQLSQEEIEAEVKKIIAEVGATSMKEMGKVMGTASKLLAGKADGRVISEIVKKLLA